MNKKLVSGSLPSSDDNKKSPHSRSRLFNNYAGGIFVLNSNGNYGNGTSDNQFSYVDDAGNTYWRTVGAALNNITYDQEGGTLAHQYYYYTEALDAMQNADQSVVGVRLPGNRHTGLFGP
jgi:hypothetical protein